MKKLFEQGEVYLRTLKSCGALENDQLRDDSESVMRQHFGEMFLEIEAEPGKRHKLKCTNVTRTDHLQGNVYCLYGVTEDLCTMTDRVDRSIVGTYDAFVIINNYDVFINRVKAGLLAVGFEVIDGFVKYIDPADESPFHKSTSHRTENEYRFVIANEKDEPVMIQISSIQDIASIHPIEHLEYLRFTSEGNTISLKWPPLAKYPIKPNAKVRLSKNIQVFVPNTFQRIDLQAGGEFVAELSDTHGHLVFRAEDSELVGLLVSLSAIEIIQAIED